MKICLIAPAFPPIIGGTETAIYEIAMSLARKGHVITVVTPNQRNGVPFEKIGVNISVYRTPVFQIPVGKSLTFQPGVYNMILQNHKMQGFDILHQFHVFYLGVASVLAKRKTRVPLVTSLMGMDTYDPFDPIPRILNPYMHWVMHNSDAITSPCHELEQRAWKQGLDKPAAIIPHGVELNRFSIDHDPSLIRNKLGIGKDEVMILAIQRLAERKKLEYLIRSVPLVIASNPNVKFVIGGRGPKEAELATLAERLNVQGNVIFTGRISDAELANYYAASDLFVLHTMYEAFGIVLAEAMASGKPVISTRVGSIPEVIDDGYNGLVVPPKDAQALAEAISRLVSNRTLRLEFGKRGREKASVQYNWDNITDQYISVYSHLK